MSLTVEEVDELFAVDEEGRFLNLVLPPDYFGDELNLIGIKQLELDLETVIRLKKYADRLYEEALK